MNLRQKLSKRIGISGVNAAVLFAKNNEYVKKELYDFLFDTDETLSYQAAWVWLHFPPEEGKWLFDKQNELIDEVMTCKHQGKRRLLLTLLLRQPFSSPPRLDFLDFCMECMFSNMEPLGIQSLCIKLAFRLSSLIPELLNIYIRTIELVDFELLPPSLRCSVTSIKKKVDPTF